MDAANKTEKISAPSGKHDDYCDSTAMALHATLSMLPMSGNFAQSIVSRPINKNYSASVGNRGTHSGVSLFTTSQRKHTLNKRGLRGI